MGLYMVYTIKGSTQPPYRHSNHTIPYEIPTQLDGITTDITTATRPRASEAVGRVD